ncbi:hypothetical protein B0H19DRAFT_1055503 [Mycena capillaripes]|nr:hypothetical protein B0H19DRAFT_1055503 [Mycena capillaripes]
MAPLLSLGLSLGLQSLIYISGSGSKLNGNRRILFCAEGSIGSTQINYSCAPSLDFPLPPATRPNSTVKPQNMTPQLPKQGTDKSDGLAGLGNGTRSSKRPCAYCKVHGMGGTKAVVRRQRKPMLVGYRSRGGHQVRPKAWSKTLKPSSQACVGPSQDKPGVGLDKA